MEHENNDNYHKHNLIFAFHLVITFDIKKCVKKHTNQTKKKKKCDEMRPDVGFKYIIGKHDLCG